ncbi:MULTISPECIES: hypothetical protein [Streptomyces]|uniref:Uncharacterized protein n=1 Tax=Streptomyces muensis TaxID=1077944 RepID=A0A9X1PS31_STRM4|nr:MULTISPECIES: hypothetical protein [Streptomyces]MCF1592472.1 hypothetical protein [Streptomyces muensis]QKV98333.1 hypothetical protein HUT19_42210 [Streptomyces sp. NA02950]
MSRRKPRSLGVSLGNGAAGPHRYRDETRVDGGKRYLHRRVRALGKAALRRLIRDETATD